MENLTNNKQKIKSYIIKNTFKNSNNILDSTLLFQEGYFDSMGFALLLEFIEEEFKVSPSDDELIEENFESIDAIAGFVSRKKTAE
ncbi:MAG: acyl carrier protein [Bacteroidales bacterium]|nr:acyl carrier protein [Bacteroidales bacterium]